VRMVVDILMEVGLVDGVIAVEQVSVEYGSFGVGLYLGAQKLLLLEVVVEDRALEDVEIVLSDLRF